MFDARATGVFLAGDKSCATTAICAVAELLRSGAAERALSEHLGASREVRCLATIENGERAFPEPVVAEGFAVANDTSVDLVDLAEATIFHRN